MSRFEDDGYNQANNRRNNIDRTVPEDENYYREKQVDINELIKDNQYTADNKEDIYNTFSNQRFTSESVEDFSRQRPERVGKRKKKKKKYIGKIILVAILVIILIVTGSGISALARLNYRDKLPNEYISADSLWSDESVRNILLLGVDSRSTDKAESSRSDTMMLVSVDSKHHCIKLISFLRDTWVYIPSLGYEQRLNAACSTGGYQNVASTIEYNFGVKIDGYVVTDFEMFKVLVDSLGGVKIDVTEAEANEVTNHPKRYGNVELKEGKHKLTGEQALAYCRIRKIDTDFVRTERQRTVISAIIKKTLSNPLKIGSMAYKSAPYLETDLTKAELMSLMTKLTSSATRLHQTSVPFDGTWEYANKYGNSVIAINREKNRDKLREYIYDLSSDDIKAMEQDKDKD